MFAVTFMLQERLAIGRGVDAVLSSGNRPLRVDGLGRVLLRALDRDEVVGLSFTIGPPKLPPYW